jgi:hypothetical protein
VLSLASPTHAAPKANQLGPEVALAAPKDGYVGRLEVAPLHGPVGSVGDNVTLVRDRRLGVRLIRRILGDAELFIDADLLIP